MKPLPVAAEKTTSASQVIKAPPTRKATPPKGSREERKERMKEKREQQRLKKMTQNKLGESDFLQPLLDIQEMVMLYREVCIN